MFLALSETASRLPFQAGSDHAVRMTCREKGGGQTTLFGNIDYCAVMDLQNALLSQGFSDLPGAEVGILKLILDHLILVFPCEPSGV